MPASWAMDVAKYGLTSIRVPRPFQKAYDLRFFRR